MFERFTDRARMVVSGAHGEANLLDHRYIGTEHLLLGLMTIDETRAKDVLLDLGFEPSEVRQQVLVRLSLADLTLNVRHPSIPQLKLQLELARAQVAAIEQKLSEAEARELLQST